MAHADLHRAVAVDSEILRDARGDARALDPVVRALGLPGQLRPFTVARAYQGPQGYYVEQFWLVDRRGRERYRSPKRRILLQGEMFEDELSNEVHGVEIDDGREHELVCAINDEVVGRVPVFVETAEGGDLRTAAEATFEQALKKSTILWVTVPQRRGRKQQEASVTRPVWFVSDGPTVYLLSGPGEQELPGIEAAEQVALSARAKDARSLIARVPCRVEPIEHDDPRYATFEKTALTKRLNLPDGEGAAERWRSTCRLYALHPELRDPDEEEPAAPAPAAAAPAAASAPAGEQSPAPAAAASAEEPHVEAQIDQSVYDKLIAEGESERTARAKAKAAYVRAERKRLREQQAS